MDASTQFALDQQLRPQPPPTTPAVPLLATTPIQPQLTVHHWSALYPASTPPATLHSTITFLHSPLLVHAALTTAPASTTPLGCVALSMYGAGVADVDAVSTSALLAAGGVEGGGGGGDGAGMAAALSARVSRMLGVHCMASVSVDEEAAGGGMAGGMAEDEVQLWIERRVMQELKTCKARGMWVTS